MTHGLKSSEGKFAAAGGRRWGQAWTFGVISDSDGTFGIYNGQNNVAQKYAYKLLVNITVKIPTITKNRTQRPSSVGTSRTFR